MMESSPSIGRFASGRIPLACISVCLSCLCLLIPTGPIAAQPDVSENVSSSEGEENRSTKFDSLVEKAQKAYKREDWKTAAETFERAYDIEEVPNLLYNIGRVYEDAGKFKKAVSYYQKFVNQPGINIDHRKDALERIDTLKKVAELEDDEEDESDASEGETEEETETRTQERKETRTSVDQFEDNYTLAIVLLSVGGAALGSGTAFGVLAANEHSEFESATTRSMRRDAGDRGQTFSTVADILLISGGVVTATGLVFTIWPLQTRTTASESRARVQPIVSPWSTGVRLEIDF